MTTAIVVAGGAGTRLGGDTPKAFRELCGQPMFCYTLATIDQCAAVDTAVLVVPEPYLDMAQRLVDSSGYSIPIQVVAGGAARWESVLIGLKAAPTETTWAAVHDAARPFASFELFTAVISAAKESGGAIAAHPATDTLKHVANSHVVETIDRKHIWLAETPQVFRLKDLVRALDHASEQGRIPTDESQAMEWSGHKIQLVENKSINLKITTPADWTYAEQVIQPSRS